MIEVKLGNGHTLIAGSNYDSGTHLNFYAGRATEGEYTMRTLDQFLTKKQLYSIEATIAVLVKGYIIDNEECGK